MERRSFLIWLVTSLASLLLVVSNLLRKIWHYVLGPKLTNKQEAKLIQAKIISLERQTKLEKLRKERLLNKKIYICKVEELQTREGLPFVDFNLKPALAFRTKAGTPILVSSVCTHLGCTVQNKLREGKLFCPCHISYFELESGKVIEGPAKIPLPKIPYVIENGEIFIIKNA